MASSGQMVGPETHIQAEKHRSVWDIEFGTSGGGAHKDDSWKYKSGGQRKTFEI